MSQSYRIRIATSVRVRVAQDAADRVVRELVLEPILPELELEEILTDILEADPNWTRDPEAGAVFVRQRDGVVERLDVSNRRLEAVAEVTEAVFDVDGDAWVDDDQTRAERAQARADHQAALEAGARARLTGSDAAQRTAERDVARQLEETEPARREELTRLVRKVSAAALKRKAARMGEITSLHEEESEGDYELVIRIHVPD